MNADTWQTIGLFAGPVLAYLAVRYTGKQTEKASTLTKDAQDDATNVTRERLGLDTLETSLAEQEKRIKRLQDDLTTERTAREAAERRAADAERRARSAEQRAEQLERRVAQLERADDH